VPKRKSVPPHPHKDDLKTIRSGIVISHERFPNRQVYCPSNPLSADFRLRSG